MFLGLHPTAAKNGPRHSDRARSCVGLFEMKHLIYTQHHILGSGDYAGRACYRFYCTWHTFRTANVERPFEEHNVFTASRGSPNPEMSDPT